MYLAGKPNHLRQHHYITDNYNRMITMIPTTTRPHDLNKVLNATKVKKAELTQSDGKLRKMITSFFNQDLTLDYLEDITTFFHTKEKEYRNKYQDVLVSQIEGEISFLQDEIEKKRVELAKVTGKIVTETAPVSSEPKRGGVDRCPTVEQVDAQVQMGNNTTKGLAEYFGVSVATFLTYKKRLNLPTTGEKSSMVYLTQEQDRLRKLNQQKTTPIESTDGDGKTTPEQIPDTVPRTPVIKQGTTLDDMEKEQGLNPLPPSQEDSGIPPQDSTGETETKGKDDVPF